MEIAISSITVVVMEIIFFLTFRGSTDPHWLLVEPTCGYCSADRKEVDPKRCSLGHVRNDCNDKN